MRSHLIKVYRDGRKVIQYCVNCGMEEDEQDWSEPCRGKIVLRPEPPSKEATEVMQFVENIKKSI